MSKFTVTLKSLRAAGACYIGYNKLVRGIQGKEFTEKDSERTSYLRHRHIEEIPVLYILESNGFKDALWSLRALSAPRDKEVRLLACCFARQVMHLNDDPRVLKAIETAERFAKGAAAISELNAARAGAAAAADAASTYAARAGAAAADAASTYVARAGAATAGAAAGAAYAATYAAHAAADATAYAAYADAADAEADAYDAAYDAAYATQRTILIYMLTA